MRLPIEKSYVFFSRVVPERFPLSVDRPLTSRVKSLDFEFEYEGTSLFHVGSVITTIKILIGNPELLTLRNFVQSDIADLVHLVSLVQGVAYSVDVVSAVDAEGMKTVFGIAIPALAPKNEIEQADAIEFFNENYKVIMGSIYARMAIEDFNKAMIYPRFTGMHCYAAIEAIMQEFKDRLVLADDRSGWRALHQSLRVTKEYILQVKRLADDPRHRRPTSMTDADRGVAFECTRAIIRRFVEFKKRGVDALPESEFPVLS